MVDAVLFGRLDRETEAVEAAAALGELLFSETGLFVEENWVIAAAAAIIRALASQFFLYYYYPIGLCLSRSVSSHGRPGRGKYKYSRGKGDGHATGGKLESPEAGLSSFSSLNAMLIFIFSVGFRRCEARRFQG